MRRTLPLIFLALLFLVLSSSILMAEQDSATVMVMKLDGPINPVSAEFVSRSIDNAIRTNAQALVIELDTPGGLDTSMREIIRRMIASSVPVVVYVSPGGARAASAGAFITIAAHVAAMAPQTNLGAAHPVSMGEKMDKVMSDKVTNDSAAFIKSIAEQRGRNAEWAQDAVRKSISSTETEALRLGVIDLVAKDLPSLMKALDGRKVKTSSGERTLKTEYARIIREDAGNRFKILGVITDPNIAYILMLLGFYGLFFELTNPGAIFPGVLGSICLILAFYSMQTLSVNYAGLLLIILAVILFVLETQILSHGVLAIGGVISLSLGSLMLFDNADPFMRISLSVLIPAVIITSAFFILTVWLAVRAQGKKSITGAEGLIGAEGKALTEINKEGGMAALHGETWRAFSDELIEKNSKVIVEAVVGLKVKIRNK